MFAGRGKLGPTFASDDVRISSELNSAQTGMRYIGLKAEPLATQWMAWRACVSHVLRDTTALVSTPFWDMSGER